jgi:hypothetical protein
VLAAHDAPPSDLVDLANLLRHHEAAAAMAPVLRDMCRSASPYMVSPSRVGRDEVGLHMSCCLLEQGRRRKGFRPPSPSSMTPCITSASVGRPRSSTSYRTRTVGCVIRMSSPQVHRRGDHHEVAVHPSDGVLQLANLLQARSPSRAGAARYAGTAGRWRLRLPAGRGPRGSTMATGVHAVEPPGTPAPNAMPPWVSVGPSSIDEHTFFCR